MPKTLTPVTFTRSVDIIPMRKGLYKDPMKDINGFKLAVTKSLPVARTRNWGDDDEYDAVMRNFGMDPSRVHEPQRLIFGYANVTVQEDGTVPFDFQGDMISTAELESAAYNYVLAHGVANQEHEYGTECGFLVESFMITKEKMQAMGIPEGLIPEGWWVGFYIPDPDVYKKVLDGTYNMFSIEGYATRVPANDVNGSDIAAGKACGNTDEDKACGGGKKDDKACGGGKKDDKACGGGKKDDKSCDGSDDGDSDDEDKEDGTCGGCK